MEKEVRGLKEEMSKTAAAAALTEFREKVEGLLGGAAGSHAL